MGVTFNSQKLSAYQNEAPGSTGVVIKAGKTQLFGVQAGSVGAIGYFHLYDTTAAATSANTSLIKLTFSSVSTAGVNWVIPGLEFANGLQLRATNLANGTSSNNPATNIVLNIAYA